MISNETGGRPFFFKGLESVTALPFGLQSIFLAHNDAGSGLVDSNCLHRHYFTSEQ